MSDQIIGLVGVATAEVVTPPNPALCVAEHPNEPCPGHSEEQQ